MNRPSEVTSAMTADDEAVSLDAVTAVTTGDAFAVRAHANEWVTVLGGTIEEIYTTDPGAETQWQAHRPTQSQCFCSRVA